MQVTSLMGFRQLLGSPSSYQDLKTIIKESHNLFAHAKNVLFVVAVCGEDPRPFLEKMELADKVTVIDICDQSDTAKLAAQKSFSLYNNGNGSKVVIVYYDTQKRGLTFPFALLVEFAKLLEVELIGLSDSDFQIPYSAIKRSYSDAYERIADLNTPILYLPLRSHRSLELEGYPINRFAMEDLENAYYWIVTKNTAKIKGYDLQSGLSFMNLSACKLLDFSKTGLWTGQIDITIQIKQQKGDVVEGITIDTNPQNESTITPEVQFKKIKELEDLHGYKLADVVSFAKTHPECLMDDWAKYLRQEEKEMILDKILAAYSGYRH